MHHADAAPCFDIMADLMLHLTLQPLGLDGLCCLLSCDTEICEQALDQSSSAPKMCAGIVQVSAGGIVTDPQIHQRVIESVTAGIVAAGFTSSGCMSSPLKGTASGNTEFLAHFQRLPQAPLKTLQA